MSELLDLRDMTPRSRGAARGEQFRGAIAASVARRRERFEGEVGPGRWDAIQRWLTEELREELAGLSAGADLAVHELALCLDEDPGVSPRLRGDPGTVALYVVSPDGGVLGQTLDVDGDDDYPVAAWLFGTPGAQRLVIGHPGSLGHCGARRGLAVTCNPLVGARPPGALEQAPWSVTLRTLLASSSSGQARAHLERLGSARGAWHVMLAAVGHDRQPDFSGVECSEKRAVRTQSGPQTGHVHASHYFDPVQRQDEGLRSNLSWNRLERATTAYAQHRPRTLSALRSFLETFVWESGPRSTRAVAAFEVATGRVQLVLAEGQPPVSVSLD